MRGEYSTRQKRVMMSFLKQHDLEPYSVDDLVFEMQEQGEKSGAARLTATLSSWRSRAACANTRMTGV